MKESLTIRGVKRGCMPVNDMSCERGYKVNCFSSSNSAAKFVLFGSKDVYKMDLILKS